MVEGVEVQCDGWFKLSKDLSRETKKYLVRQSKSDYLLIPDNFFVHNPNLPNADAIQLKKTADLKDNIAIKILGKTVFQRRVLECN